MTEEWMNDTKYKVQRWNIQTVCHCISMETNSLSHQENTWFLTVYKIIFSRSLKRTCCSLSVMVAHRLFSLLLEKKNNINIGLTIWSYNSSYIFILKLMLQYHSMWKHQLLILLQVVKELLCLLGKSSLFLLLLFLGLLFFLVLVDLDPSKC